ncbi:MAG: DUF167 domain-containing protein [Chloroflexota bacterium]
MARLRVQVQPGASRDELRLEGDTLHARLAAPAVEGKANKRLIQLVAKLLRVPRSHVSIVRGETAREKLLEFEGLSAPELAERIAALG